MYCRRLIDRTTFKSKRAPLEKSGAFFRRGDPRADAAFND